MPKPSALAAFALAQAISADAAQTAQPSTKPFIVGADISGVQAAEARGVKWAPTSSLNGQALFNHAGAVIPEKMAAYDALKKSLEAERP
jgi:arabinogalactan endo-1,4-beta-galactosidase